MRDFFGHQSYCFIFAHPDDEMYTTTITKRLTDAGKRVDFIYLTSGDYRGKEVSLEREREVASAAQLLGVDESRLHLLRLSEVNLAHTYQNASDAILKLLTELQPDCIVSHDYEGGNNCHDLSSMCTGLVAKRFGAAFWVFPAYHKQPEQRVWSLFAHSKQPDLHLILNEVEIAFKKKIWQQHATEAAFFARVLASDSKDRFTGEEMIRHIGELPDYLEKPTDPVGYDFPDSPVNYADFHEAAVRVMAKYR